MKYGAAVVGLGVGRSHIDSYRDEGRAEVRVVCDVDEDLARTVAEEKGVDEVTTRFEDLLDREDIQLVSVCTPDHLHAQVAVPLLEAGKHLLIEKPLATSAEDIRRIVDAAEAHGVKVQHGCQLRFMPLFRELHRRVAAGEFGDIFYAEGDYVGPALQLFTDGWRGRLGGEYNPVAGGGVHPIDLMIWYIDSRPVEVHSYANRIAFSRHGLETLDCVVSLIRFENGAVAKTLNSFGCVRPGFRNIHLYGTRATFLTSPVPPPSLYADESSPREWTPIEVEDGGDARVGLIADWIDAIEEDRDPLVGVRAAATVASVCTAAFASARSGRPEPVEAY